jgi:twitching motility two-component system response regulator PilH
MAHILIVDDSPTESHVLRQFFEASGYMVSEACNGREGIEVAKVQQPDLIIMDVVMPGLNGFQATRELGRRQETVNIPVIMYSAKNQVTDRMWALQQGASAYLIKPVSEKTLLSTIQRYLHKEISHDDPL